MEVTEGPSALEVAAVENSALKDGAGAYPAPEGVAGDDPARMGDASCDPAPEGVRVLPHFHGCSRRVFSSTLWLHGDSPSLRSRSRFRGQHT
jgi:hypothetical protein